MTRTLIRRLLDDAILFNDESIIRRYAQRFGSGDSLIARDLSFERAIGPIEESRWLTRGWDMKYSAVQYWDKPSIPQDVQRSIDKNVDYFGHNAHRLFDREMVKDFIREHYSRRVIEAFEYCGHPSPESDFFRFIYLYACGGLYIDADMEIIAGFNAKLFDCDDQIIMSSAIRRSKQEAKGGWYWYKLPDLLNNEVDQDSVCYFHSDILAATPFNEIVRIAIVRMVLLLEECVREGKRPGAHFVTGPTNLTVATIIHLIRSSIKGQKASSVIIFDREKCTFSGSYEYRQDERNWRLSENQEVSIKNA